MNGPQLSDSEKEGAKFLDRDFTQCFEQMRHHDGQIVDICKFAFTGYVTVIGAVLTLYRYGSEKGFAFVMPAVVVLCLTAILGFMLLGLVVRNRAYFVLMARYVNEQRQFFLTDKPLGFLNETHMYTNRTKPSYFYWPSSQSFLMYIMATLNATMFVFAGIVLWWAGSHAYWWFWLLAVAAWLVQLITAIDYLRIQERKPREPNPPREIQGGEMQRGHS
ncbi:MAG: hypothetical protein ABSH08_15000 [Tepidisphaeraceae bacterium]|jgi:hypothetical protein